MNIQEAERTLREEIQESKIKDNIIFLSDAAKEKEAETNFKRYGTGILSFDEVARLRDGDEGGIAGGDLVVVAGPTGNGKTTYAATLTYNLLKLQSMPSLWFTYEISVYNLWKIFENMGCASQVPICVPANHTTGKVEWLEQKIEEGIKNYMVGHVVIDHLGFLAPKQRMNDNMSQNYSSYLGQIVRELKTIAVKYNITITLPVHMVKSASDDPTLRDIGHSGGIAQESDFVLLVAREENRNKKMTSMLGRDDYYTPYTKVILAKNRIGGKTPTWKMKIENGRLVETFDDMPNANIYD